VKSHKDNLYEGQSVDPIYSSGKYFEDPNIYSRDAQYKADHFIKIFLGFARQYNITIHSWVDVGCGSGDITKIIASSQKKEGITLDIMKGYDVSPHVQTPRHEEVEFVHRDFCESDELVDLVTLFDVFEHIPNPIHFIQMVAL
jgi:2-polyprenyl-3-methyl-5-hydroxy-6-metoxy-1,4-benzoquinol methylase